MPKAIAPSAPCVEVWLSPHAMVMPGCVSPISGPITCTMPWCPAPSSPGANSWMPNSRQFRSSADVISSAVRSMNGRFCELVGTMWSTVANVRSGNATPQPCWRIMSNACGLVTSCTRWRPTKSCVWPLGSVRTACAFQTFSKRVGMGTLMIPRCRLPAPALALEAPLRSPRAPRLRGRSRRHACRRRCPPRESASRLRGHSGPIRPRAGNGRAARSLRRPR